MLRELIVSALLLTSQPTTSEVEQLLIDRSHAHGADPELVLRVARCENRNLTPGLLSPSQTTIGIGQWLRGRGNHWDLTPAYTVYNLDIFNLYASNDPNALYYDVDQFAWSMSQLHLRNGWSCYRILYGAN